MNSIYEAINATANSSSMDQAIEILFGFNNLSTNIDKYYKRIISSSVRKKILLLIK